MDQLKRQDVGRGPAGNRQTATHGVSGPPQRSLEPPDCFDKVKGNANLIERYGKSLIEVETFARSYGCHTIAVPGSQSDRRSALEVMLASLDASIALRGQ